MRCRSPGRRGCPLLHHLLALHGPLLHRLLPLHGLLLAHRLHLGLLRLPLLGHRLLAGGLGLHLPGAGLGAGRLALHRGGPLRGHRLLALGVPGLDLRLPLAGEILLARGLKTGARGHGRGCGGRRGFRGDCRSRRDRKSVV